MSSKDIPAELMEAIAKVKVQDLVMFQLGLAIMLYHVPPMRRREMIDVLEEILVGLEDDAANYPPEIQNDPNFHKAMMAIREGIPATIEEFKKPPVKPPNPPSPDQLEMLGQIMSYFAIEKDKNLSPNPLAMALGYVCDRYSNLSDAQKQNIKSTVKDAGKTVSKHTAKTINHATKATGWKDFLQRITEEPVAPEPKPKPKAFPG